MAGAADLTLYPFLVERERDRRAQRHRQRVRSARQHDHRARGAAREGRREPARQPVRRRHAAEHLHRPPSRLLSRPHKGPRADRSTDLFDKIGATPNFPETVREAITVDGEIRKIPTGVHIDGMIYYNKKVAEAAGVDPTKWASLDDMCADQEKVNDAGYTFIAMGGNTFQAGYLFHAAARRHRRARHLQPLLRRDARQDRVRRTGPARRDRDVPQDHRPGRRGLGEPRVERDHQHGDRRQALMQIHGDWMKGQWSANGKVLGEDFGCINIPGTKALSVTVDCLRHPRRRRRATLKAELDFAAIVVDPKINAEFASSRARARCALDVPTDKLDACNKLVLDSLKKAGFSVQNPFYIADTDWHQLGVEHDVHVPGRPGHDHRRRHRDAESEYAAVFP